MKKLFTLFAAAALMVCAASAQEHANFNFGGRGPRIVSPEIQGDSVTFRLDANYATVVTLQGNWGGPAIPMHKEANGVWSVKIPVPGCDIYTYNFVVDGVSVNDPLNFYVQRDGQRYLNMLMVPGEVTENYFEANHRGTVHYAWYDSEILGINRRLTVYTPYGYDDKQNKNKKYPVLYLLHGAGGDEEAWTSMGRAAEILDNLIEKGQAVPMIVVMPNGNANQQATQTMGIPTAPAANRNGANPGIANAYVNSLANEIVPYIESHYRVIAKPESRAVAGLSMGGGHTFTVTNLNPGKFGYVSLFSAAARFTINDEFEKTMKAVFDAKPKFYFIACGVDDSLITNSYALDEYLTKMNYPHEVLWTSGAHTWSNWRIYLNTIAPRLFK